MYVFVSVFLGFSTHLLPVIVVLVFPPSSAPEAFRTGTATRQSTSEKRWK